LVELLAGVILEEGSQGTHSVEVIEARITRTRGQVELSITDMEVNPTGPSLATSIQPINIKYTSEPDPVWHPFVRRTR